MFSLWNISITILNPFYSLPSLMRMLLNFTNFSSTGATKGEGVFEIQISLVRPEALDVIESLGVKTIHIKEFYLLFIYQSFII